MSDTPIRVLIADDQALMRTGFRMILDAQDDIEVVGEAIDGEDAIRGFERLSPDPDEAAKRMARPPTRETERDLMRWLVERAMADRPAHLALFELRLEATRNPRLAPAVTRHFAGNLALATSDHVDGGFPGDRATVLVLYLAMTGLLLEHLTMPDLLGEDAARRVVDRIVEAVVPEE